MKTIPAGTPARVVTDRLFKPRRFIAVRGEQLTAVSWMLAIGLAFLSTGIAGANRPVVDLASHHHAPQTPEPPVPVQDITMTDLQGEPAPATDETRPRPEEETPPEPEEILTEEDIVEIPDAPPVEDAIPLLEPKPERRDPPPVVRPHQPQPQPRPRPAATPAPQPAATTAPGGQGAGGSDGAGPGKGAGGRGKFPYPPYPAFAKARGLTGTVTLSISVAPGGEVTSVSVAGSCGSSELDSHAASWVQRRWKWPAGGVRHFRMPVTFRLR